ncbi:glycosyltransferase BC10-like [Rutidosis leptorrhynchoides]|uniref:glycosyltransferase BC10-like n=1 Tax=Rutidosis leptorrhynchoides TaxID=125765 RepID=UPI003A9944D2
MFYSSPLIPAIILLILCIPILFYLGPHILPPPQPPPITFPDELQDLTLFRRATIVDSVNPSKSKPIRLGSTNSKPKIAFLFLTNSDLQFAPLWEIFFNTNSSKSFDLFTIYVHADPTVNPKVKIPGGVFTDDRFIRAKQTRRGTATLIAAARRLLATALLDDPNNAFFTLVSQHCIPLHSFKYFYDTLFEVNTHQVAELRHLKYKSFIEIVSKDPYILDRYNARGENVMVPEVPFDKFRMGSQFFTLTRRHAVMVVGDRKLWKKFRINCLRPQSCYPEEHYFPTLLSMEDLKGCTSYTLTRVNWTDSVDGHPRTYYPNEVSKELIYELRKSNFTKPYMFARKFSPDCLEPLMNMANEVIFRD